MLPPSQGCVVQNRWMPEERPRRAWALFFVALGVVALCVFACWGLRGPDWGGRTDQGPAKIVLGVLGLGLLLGVRGLAGSPHARALRALCLGVVLGAGAFAWTGFGEGRGNRWVHHHEFFHYDLGAKYSLENGYQRIYDCAIEAEAADGYPVAGRAVRNLQENRGGTAEEVLAAGHGCAAVFGAERWAAFGQDVRVYRALKGRGGWNRLFKDKGYNATPVWNALARPLSNWNWQSWVPSPYELWTRSALLGASEWHTERRKRAFKAQVDAMEARLFGLSMIDPVLYLASVGLVVWAFGWEAAALMVLVFGVGLPWDFRYTGGAYGRVVWFFSGTAAICLLKRGWARLGGGALALSAALRMFPAALFGGMAMAAVWGLLRRRGLGRGHRRVVLGATVVFLGGIGLASLQGGLPLWKDFLANTQRHASTPLTNHAGLKALLSDAPKTRVRHLQDKALPDQYAPWRAARMVRIAQRRPLILAATVGLFGLVALAVRRQADWERVVSSTVLIVALVDLTSYYFLFMLWWALPAQRSRLGTVAIVAMAIATQISRLRTNWNDVDNLGQSLIALCFMIGMLGLPLLQAQLGRASARLWTGGGRASKVAGVGDGGVGGLSAGTRG